MITILNKTLVLRPDCQYMQFGNRKAYMLHTLSTEVTPCTWPVCVTAGGDGVGLMEMASFRQNSLVAMPFLSPLLTSVTGNDLHRFLNLSLLIST